MEKFDSFASVFGSSPDTAYDSKAIDTITRHRRLLENTLFFDRLLNAVGVHDASDHYPPRSNSSLQTLYDEIMNASATDTHKAALLYYLLRDLKSQDTHAAQTFAQATYLPERYIILIDGLWYLDRLKLKEALSYLTEPTLIPTFEEEILYTLARQSPQNPELVLEYYNTTSPTITSTKTLNAYSNALASASITEAFFFSRRQAETRRKHLFEQLLAFVHGSSSGEARAKRGMELVGLPFDHEEETWFEDFLLRDKGKGLFGAKDTVIVRRIATGRGGDVDTLTKDIKERRIDGLTWTGLTRGLSLN